MSKAVQYELADPGTISAGVFDDEIVVANFTTGIYYSLRFAAAEIWLGLMAGVPADRVVQIMSLHIAAVPAKFTDAARSFIASLEGEHLIKPATRTTDESWRPRLEYGPFEAPAFERFTDM